MIVITYGFHSCSAMSEFGELQKVDYNSQHLLPAVEY